MLGVDIGGATTDVFSVFGGAFNRTVSANLGMSYSISNVLTEAGLEAIARWLPFEMTDADLKDRMGNKMIRPTSIPQTMEELVIEQAVAREALRLAFEQHRDFAVALKGVQQRRTISDTFEQQTGGQTLVDLMNLDLIIGSGGVLSHAPGRSQAALMMVDAFQPEGITNLAVDSIFMMPHLGVLSTVHETAALEVFDRDCLVHLGPCVAPRRLGSDRRSVRDRQGQVGRRGMDAPGRRGRTGRDPGRGGGRGHTGGRAVPKFRRRRRQRRAGHPDRAERSPGRNHRHPGQAASTAVERGRKGRDAAKGLPRARRLPGARLMAHAYTSGLRVSPRTVVAKTRRLPLSGQVLVRVGDLVRPDTVVAETFLPGPVHNVNVANALAIAPEDVPGSMLMQRGDPVAKGELIAESRGIFGLFKSSVRCPENGTIEMVSEVTGQVLIREGSTPVRINAYLDGRVTGLLPGEGVVVETAGACIQGIFGVGGETHAPIRQIVQSPEEEVTEDMIDDRLRGRIVCCGSMITLDALRKLIGIGASGVVVGGMQYHDIGDLLGYQIGVAVTGGEDIGLTMVVTEGFGRLPMARRTFELLGSLQGREASLSGATQIRAGVIRPEIIIKSDGGEAPPDRADPAGRGLEAGSLVRIIRKPGSGKSSRWRRCPNNP